MKSGWTCPKCKGRDPIVIEARKGGHGGVPTTRFMLSNMHPGRFICSACGYSEAWFEREQLEALRKRYGPASR